jgi:hypothetical protein
MFYYEHNERATLRAAKSVRDSRQSTHLFLSAISTLLLRPTLTFCPSAAIVLS